MNIKLPPQLKPVISLNWKLLIETFLGISDKSWLRAFSQLKVFLLIRSGFVLCGHHTILQKYIIKFEIESKAPSISLNLNQHHNFYCLPLTAFSIKNLNQNFIENPLLACISHSCCFKKFSYSWRKMRGFVNRITIFSAFSEFHSFYSVP